MDLVGVIVSPVGLLLAFAWNFLVLASVQLTVRLIRAFSVSRTAAAALALTAGTIPITVAYLAILGGKLDWLPAMIGLTGLLGYIVAVGVLKLRRRRSAVAAALGIGLLSAPWGAFLVR
jgi:putative effector of murein hydrolase